MSRTIEVELKFEILDPVQIDQFLQPLRKTGERHVIDVYLDTPAGELFKRGIFIRIRNGETFDIKFNREDMQKALDEAIQHTHCDEVSSALPLTVDGLIAVNQTLSYLGMQPIEQPSLEELKERNQLVDSMTIDKHRASYDAGEFHIDVDEVRGLGTYLEIEKMTGESADHEPIIASMRAFVQGLQLHYVDTGYNELYWRKHDFELYLQGKYLLEEDRKKYRPRSMPA